MKTIIKTFISAVAFVLMINVASAAEEIHKFDTPEQKLLYQQLAEDLRCPKCQNQNIADSNAGIAKDLRNKVAKLVQQGQSKDQVVDFMVERYGYFVYYKPPVTAGTLILWLLPIFFALFTMVLIWLKAKRSQANVEQPEWDDKQEQQLAKLISATAGQSAGASK